MYIFQDFFWSAYWKITGKTCTKNYSKPKWEAEQKYWFDSSDFAEDEDGLDDSDNWSTPQWQIGKAQPKDVNKSTA